MFTLPAKRDGFRLLLPKELIPEEIEEKYTKILKEAHSFITKPIDFLNETIQKVQVLGFNNGTVEQQQTDHQHHIRIPSSIPSLQGGSSPFIYRNSDTPLALLDKTLNVDFKHTLGYLNYFLLFESFWYMYSRDTQYFDDLKYDFTIDLLNEKGSIYSRIVLQKPLIDGMDMLDFDFTQPLASSSTFRCIFKYSNIDYQFLNYTNETTSSTIIPYDTYIEEEKKKKKREDESYNKYPYQENEKYKNSQIEIIKSLDNSRTDVDENNMSIDK